MKIDQFSRLYPDSIRTVLSGADSIKLLLFSAFSFFPNQHNSNNNHIDTDVPTIGSSYDHTSVSSKLSSPVLDTLPALYQSLLYYHIARGSDGVFNVRQKCERVHDLSGRIQKTAGDRMPPEIVELFRGLIFTESGGDPKALSVAGARGVAQIMKSTAAQYGGYGNDYDKRIDVDWSLQTAVKILSTHYTSFGDWSLAFAAYHMGHGNMTTLRQIYQQTMGKPLLSMKQLYTDIPSQAVINWFASKQDDTFGYVAKIYNAVTLLRLYEEDRPYFDSLIKKYTDLPYDVRGIVAENTLFDVDDYFCGQEDVMDAINKQQIVALDHAGFVCGSYDFENHLHADVGVVLATIATMYGSKPVVTCGLLDDEVIGGNRRHTNDLQTLRLGSHTTGKAIDIAAPSNSFVGKQLVASDEFRRMEYVLTILRMQGKIIWCREFDPKRTKVLHFHIVVL